MDNQELNPSRVGRPTKYSEPTIERLCSALALGMPIKAACSVAGIGVTTLAEWRKQKPELEEEMDEARELARQKALQTIWAAGEKDWRAHAEWLRLTFPADYRVSANKIEVSATANTSSRLAISAEELKQLQEPVISHERLSELQEARRVALERTNEQ